MEIGDKKIYRECGELIEVEIIAMREVDGGEEFELRVLCDLDHGGFIDEAAWLKKDATFNVWRTNGSGRSQCGWSMSDYGETFN
jgi:hypothetical protein